MSPIKIKDRDKDKPDKPQPPTTPPPATTTPAPTSVKVGRPTGKIPSDLKIAYGRGGDWSKVTVDAPFHEQYGNPYGIAAMLAAMEVIESGGQMIWNTGGSGAFGIMQIKEANWGWLAKQLGVSLQTREGQVAVAAAILGWAGVGKTPRERFLNSYYPVYRDGQLCLSCTGEDGGTPQQYLDDMDRLVGIINAARDGITPADPPGDVIDMLFGGRPYEISAEYGQLVTWSCPGCYDYFPAYGLDTKHHWAYDVAATAGDGAPLYAPFNGQVVCAGTGVGQGAWGTGCAAFDRLNNYGSPKPNGTGHGRLELLHEDGHASLIIGHALSSRVRAGDRVQAGDLIGYQGGMNGSHVHLEGRYDQGRKIGDPRKLFGGGPMPVERVRYDFENDPNMFTVKALKDVTVYQRADPSSPVLYVIPKGETFEAVAIVPGNDGEQWWLGRINGGRVPMAGTEPVKAA